MLHVELVHNLCSGAAVIFGDSHSLAEVPFNDMLRYGLNAPYLMNELLSLSALHLSIVKPEKRSFYQHQSTQLQNHALNSFNAMSSHITDENTPPIFLFAGALGMHKQCETLVYRDNDFEGFIDRFVQYVILHRGVRVVVGQGRWEFLHQTSLKPLLEHGSKIPSLDSPLGPVCQGLLDWVQIRSLDNSHTEVYQQAIQAVQAVMTVVEGRVPGASSLHVLIAWPVLLSSEFIDLLSEKRGEALVIFAYYGALVNAHRDIWVFCDGGEYIVNSVSQYLGSQWEEWLRWPLQALSGQIHECI